MEMGLFDDAIKEFRTAGKDPDRRTDSLTLQAVCCREKGDFDEAERLFKTEISGNGLDTDRILSLRYELGLLYEAAGRKDDALQSYREVFGVNPGFRDTMKKIARLSGNKGTFDLSDIVDVDIELEEIR
jgi:tetratricopeptide (TPR) repeat protein